MTKLVGIDLGTTFSAISYLNSAGKPEIIPNSEGERITPSIAWFPKDQKGKIIVGKEAEKALLREPERVVTGVKRIMGTDEKITIDKKDYSPQQISSLIIKKLVNDATQKIGKIDQAVITIPAHFSEEARKATIKAGEEAGLKIEHIINEPSAAALFYTNESENNDDGLILVYDLGGGTFDVSIVDVKISKKKVDVRTSQGDQLLGGHDFTDKIIEIFNEAYKKKYNVNLVDKKNKLTYKKFFSIAEEAKKTLSKLDKTSVELNGSKGSLNVEVSKKEFENSISTLLIRTELLIDGALKDLKIKENSIDDIILVGGSTRINAVQNLIKKKFNKQPKIALNVDEAVSLGAAIYAGFMAPDAKLNKEQKEKVKEINFEDVTNHHFGTISVGVSEEKGKAVLENDIIIEKNTKLPCKETKSYQTIHDGQTGVDIKVTQSTHKEKDPDLVTVIYETKLSLPEGRPSGQKIDATYSYDENQVMHVEFTDIASGKKIESKLEIKGIDDDDPIDGFIVE